MKCIFLRNECCDSSLFFLLGINSYDSVKREQCLHAKPFSTNIQDTLDVQPIIVICLWFFLAWFFLIAWLCGLFSKIAERMVIWSEWGIID
jgi:hypothetical protein